MPQLTVNLARTYALSLKQNRVEPIDWQTMPGQNKLRRFFVHAQWKDYIASVNVSSSGLKGGVFFLEAHVVDTNTFVQQLNALNVKIDPDGAWRRLHSDQYLADGVVSSQVMQAGFSLTNPFYGRTAQARNNLLTAIRNAAQPRKRYVVKGTNEPGRILFAEYVLNTIGKAKIPKSLVLEVDPSRPHTHADPSEGMIMLNVINTKRNAAADVARYNHAYGSLHDGTQPLVDYLVVQKLLGGDSIVDSKELAGRVVKFLCDQKVIVDVFSFLSDPNFAGESSASIGFLVKELTQRRCLDHGLVDPNFQTQLTNVQTLSTKKNQIQAVLDAVLPTLANNQLQSQDYANKSPAAQFDQLVNDLQNKNTALKQALEQFLAGIQPIVATNRDILTDVNMMKNTGRVHFVDALLANGDRFNNFNTGNFFYISKQAAQGSNKATNPVGCIDNDSFFQTYLPKGHTEGFRDVYNYVGQVLAPSTEFWGWNDPMPQGTALAQLVRLADALEFDQWFNGTFFDRFIAAGLPEAVMERYGVNLFKKGDADPFLATKALQWTHVSHLLREGICRALVDYQRTSIKEFESVYRALTEMYYPGPNFEFTALQIRDRYLRECKVDLSTWTIQLPTQEVQTGVDKKNKPIMKEKIRLDVAEWLQGAKHVNPECDDPQPAPIADSALTYGNQNGDITAAEEQSIRSLLVTLSVSDQERLIPNPFGPVSLSTMDPIKRHELQERWAKLRTKTNLKYLQRIDVVICSLLHKFGTDYIAEIGYVTNDRSRVVHSRAFAAAVALCNQVSDLELYRDVKRKKPARQTVLGTLNLGNYVTL